MLTPTTPVVESYESRLPSSSIVTFSHSITHYEIESFAFTKDPNDTIGVTARLVVVWSKGFDDGPSYVAVYRATREFTGQALGAALMGTVPTGSTYYDAVRGAIWTLLQAAGDAPAGAIS